MQGDGGWKVNGNGKNTMKNKLVKIPFLLSNHPHWTKLFGHLNIASHASVHLPLLVSLSWLFPPKCPSVAKNPAHFCTNSIHKNVLELKPFPPVPQTLTYNATVTMISLYCSCLSACLPQEHEFLRAGITVSPFLLSFSTEHRGYTISHTTKPHTQKNSQA